MFICHLLANKRLSKVGKIWFKFSMSVSRVRVGVRADWQPSLLLRTRADNGTVGHGSWVKWVNISG